jgi:hypothetical protein
MSSPLMDHNSSSKTLVINDGVIKGVTEQKPKGCKSKNSLDNKKIFLQNFKKISSCKAFTT